MSERPWPEWKHGKPITERQVARLLHRFGIRPTQLWMDQQKTRGYELTAFGDAVERYLPADPVAAVDLSDGTPIPGSDDAVGGSGLPDAELCEKPRGDSDLPVLPDQIGNLEENDEPAASPRGLVDESTHVRPANAPRSGRETPELDPDEAAREAMRDGA
jgi:hypothetical protein